MVWWKRDIYHLICQSARTEPLYRYCTVRTSGYRGGVTKAASSDEKWLAGSPLSASPSLSNMENPMRETAEFSVALPRSMDTRIYFRLTVQAKAITLFVTTAAVDEANAPVPIGSFVYAIPDARVFPIQLLGHFWVTSMQRFNPSQPLATPLVVVEPTLEFTTRLARLLAKKSQMPVYVGNSISLASTGLGGTMEEEMEAFKKVVEVVLPRLQPLLVDSSTVPNGTWATIQLNALLGRVKQMTNSFLQWGPPWMSLGCLDVCHVCWMGTAYSWCMWRMWLLPSPKSAGFSVFGHDKYICNRSKSWPYYSEGSLNLWH